MAQQILNNNHKIFLNEEELTRLLSKRKTKVDTFFSKIRTIARFMSISKKNKKTKPSKISFEKPSELEKIEEDSPLVIKDK